MLHELLNNQPRFIGGQLKFYLDRWKEITSDPFVLTAVSSCEIEFDHEPTPSRHNFTPEYKFSVGEQQAIDNEITEFLAKNIIELSSPEQGEIISPIFIRPKKESGKVRVIFNLKHLTMQSRIENSKWIH